MNLGQENPNIGATKLASSQFESLKGIVDLDFPEYDRPPAEPINLLRKWVEEAEVIGIREPKALALATADSMAIASNRIVVVISISERGLVFASHSDSQKGREIAMTHWASGLLYWRETGQQLIVSGEVKPLMEPESDALWARRPIPLHAMSSVSNQSAPLLDVKALRTEASDLQIQNQALPRPESYVGYCLSPSVVEFWCAASDRLHRRLRYDLSPDGWQASRLQP